MLLQYFFYLRLFFFIWLLSWKGANRKIGAIVGGKRLEYINDWFKPIFLLSLNDSFLIHMVDFVPHPPLAKLRLWEQGYSYPCSRWRWVIFVPLERILHYQLASRLCVPWSQCEHRSRATRNQTLVAVLIEQHDAKLLLRYYQPHCNGL